MNKFHKIQKKLFYNRTYFRTFARLKTQVNNVKIRAIQYSIKGS